MRIGRKRVERLMRRAGLSGQLRRRRGKTTIRVHGDRTAPDLVERDFNPTEPNRLWAADITYIQTWEGWLYPASVMDLYSRRIVGWALAEHLRADSQNRRTESRRFADRVHQQDGIHVNLNGPSRLTNPVSTEPGEVHVPVRDACWRREATVARADAEALG